MRPYRRKYHSSWRTRSAKGVIGEVKDYLKPFARSTKAIWKLESPFPLTAKIAITALTWLLLFLPLCYFFLPLLSVLFLLQYFNSKINLEFCATYLGEICARSNWPGKIAVSVRIFDRLIIAFFLYDYYQILNSLRNE